MLEGEKVLVTGASGKIAFPIARRLAEGNEVWGVARLREATQREKLEEAGVRPLPLDISGGDLSSLPEDFTYVFHAAVDTGEGDWRRCVRDERPGLGLTSCSDAGGPRASSTARRAPSTAIRVSGH